MAGLTDTQLACVRHLHRNGGSVSQGGGFSITVVRALESAGIVTVHEYVLNALYERRGKTWIATLTPERLAMARAFPVPVAWGFGNWFEATRLMNPTQADMAHDSDMTRAIRKTWVESRRVSGRDDMTLTAPLAVLTGIAALAEVAMQTGTPFNPLNKEDGQAFLDAVAVLK